MRLPVVDLRGIEPLRALRMLRAADDYLYGEDGVWVKARGQQFVLLLPAPF